MGEELADRACNRDSAKDLKERVGDVHREEGERGKDEQAARWCDEAADGIWAVAVHEELGASPVDRRVETADDGLGLPDPQDQKRERNRSQSLNPSRSIKGSVEAAHLQSSRATHVRR